MLVARALQEAGRERRLDVGQVYDLADPVALALIATGAACRYTAVAPPEIKPDAPLETARRRTR
jgi:hypothetical protein